MGTRSQLPSQPEDDFTYQDDQQIMPDDAAPDLAPGEVPPLQRKWWPYLVAVAVGAVVLVSGIVATASGSDDATNDARSSLTLLEETKAECAEQTTAVRIGDGGRTMTVDNVAAEEEAGATLVELACLLAEIEVPDAVVSRIDKTRALDGMQEATWDSFSATWTYHPDSGLNLILQEN